jgi:molybdate transport system ATP-binding protein
MDALRVDVVVPLRGFDVELTLSAGRETIALVGPSGAGKTTLLRAVAGLTRPARGVVAASATTWFDSERRIDEPPERRSVGYVFQDYALFPHLSVRRNVAFGGAARVDELLARLRIDRLANARPGELSGGERQRVAVARALARDPEVLLLDEPLAALDAHTRTAMRLELQQLLHELARPALLVTHDFEDAAALADRVGVVLDGRLLQLATPAALVAEPAHPFVASLTGGNLLPGLARPGPDGLTDVVLDDGTLVRSTDEAEGRVGVVVHPWEITVARESAPGSALNRVRAPIREIVPAGNRMRVRVGPLTAEITAASASDLGLEPGDVVVAMFKATASRLTPLAG